MYSNESEDGVLDGKILTVIYSIGLHVMFNRYALENTEAKYFVFVMARYASGKPLAERSVRLVRGNAFP